MGSRASSTAMGFPSSSKATRSTSSIDDDARAYARTHASDGRSTNAPSRSPSTASPEATIANDPAPRCDARAGTSPRRTAASSSPGTTRGARRGRRPRRRCRAAARRARRERERGEGERARARAPHARHRRSQTPPLHAEDRQPPRERHAARLDRRDRAIMIARAERDDPRVVVARPLVPRVTRADGHPQPQPARVPLHHRRYRQVAGARLDRDRHRRRARDGPS